MEAGVHQGWRTAPAARSPSAATPSDHATPDPTWRHARALVATAVAVGLVAVIALLMGEHRSPVTSVLEILGLNGMFATLFLTSAWLFRKAARGRPAAARRREA